jgi:3-oxoacyl-[acyl-carrier-protein] synthase-3
MRFRHVAIEAVSYELPTKKVTSNELENRLNDTTTRLKLPQRPIEPLTGISERRFWDPGTLVSDVAAKVARKAMAAAGIEPDKVGILINTSVSKDYIEPSMASLVHGDLGLRADCLNFDIANACLGFMNGIEVAGRMIEEGIVDYALLVDGESAGEIVDSTIKRMAELDLTAKDFWDNFATLTLGSVAVAMVLTNARLSKTTHRLNGSVTLADTTQNRLCLGTNDWMVTQSTRLLKAGVELALKTWNKAAGQLPGWASEKIEHFICHQVGKPHVMAICEALGIDAEKCFLTFPHHGNVGPAAVPLTLALADESGRMRKGDHVALMGIGSGLNVTMMSVTW